MFGLKYSVSWATGLFINQLKKVQVFISVNLLEIVNCFTGK